MILFSVFKKENAATLEFHTPRSALVPGSMTGPGGCMYYNPCDSNDFDMCQK